MLRRIVCGIGFSIAFAAACGGGDGGSEPQPVLALGKASPSGDTQTDTVLATLVIPYRVRVTQDGVAEQGVTVTWSVPSGQGSVSPTSTATNAAGEAQVTRTLGPTAGQQTAQAAVSGATGSPQTFTATAQAGNPAELLKTGGDGGSATPGSDVTYTVTAEDGHGNPKASVTIDWAVTGGGGTITPTENATGAAGTASATRTLSTTEGPHTASATADAIPATVEFSTTAAAAPSTAGVTVANPYQFEPSSVTVADGGQVTWTWQGGVDHNVTFRTTGSPSNCPTTMTTDATCERTFSSAGTYDYVCTIHEAQGMTGSVTVQ